MADEATVRAAVLAAFHAATSMGRPIDQCYRAAIDACHRFFPDAAYEFVAQHAVGIILAAKREDELLRIDID